MVLYTIPIWGDLRDYSNTTEIKTWFNNIIHNSGLDIRSAVLEIEVEGIYNEVIQYRDEPG